MSKTMKLLLGCALLAVLAVVLATLLGGGMLAWFSFASAGSGPLLEEAVEVPQTVEAGALLYWRDDKIMLLPAPGAAEIELGSGQNPVLSPDGRWVACYDEDAVLFRDMTVAFADPRFQSSSVAAIGRPLALAWSPDGGQLAVVLFGDDGRGQLALCAPVAEPRVIYRHAGMLFAPAWSADGKSLVAHDMVNLIRVDRTGVISETTPLVTFTGNSEAITSTDVYRYCPTDSGLLVFTRLVPPSPAQLQAHNGEPNTAIFLYDFRTQRATRLSGENMLALNPQWTADGAALRFTGYPDTAVTGGNPFRVYEMQRDGSGQRELARGEIF